MRNHSYIRLRFVNAREDCLKQITAQKKTKFISIMSFDVWLFQGRQLYGNAEKWAAELWLKHDKEQREKRVHGARSNGGTCWPLELHKGSVRIARAIVYSQWARTAVGPPVVCPCCCCAAAALPGKKLFDPVRPHQTKRERKRNIKGVALYSRLLYELHYRARVICSCHMTLMLPAAFQLPCLVQRENISRPKPSKTKKTQLDTMYGSTSTISCWPCNQTDRNHQSINF